MNTLLQNETALIMISIIASSIPFFIWILFFRKIKRENTWLTIKTAIGGVICAIPILLLQYFMQKEGVFDLNIITGEIHVYDVFNGIKANFSNIYLQTILIFMVVGVLEEYAKHLVVEKVDSHKSNFKSIIDSIQFSIIAALGFTLIENAIYFYHILQIEGFEGFFIPFVMRSILSVFAHIFFSAVYGYHYGIAKFAREEMIEQMGHGQHFKILHIISKYTKIDMVTLFKNKEIALGLAISMTLHAIFNFLLAMELLFLAIPYIGIGYLYVMYEFDIKENLINYRKIEDEIKADKLISSLHKDKKLYVK